MIQTRVTSVVPACTWIIALFTLQYVWSSNLNPLATPVKEQRQIFSNDQNTPTLKSSTSHGYYCTEEEIKFQIDYFDYVGVHICAEDIWRTIQLLLPSASHFIDVGANRGYFAAMIFGLWSPGHGLNRKHLFEGLQELSKQGMLKNDNQINTYCRDGFEDDFPLVCFGRYSGKCFSRKKMFVYSFDGQETHYLDAVTTIKHRYPHLLPEFQPNSSRTAVKGTWIYNYVALADSFDTNNPYGYFQVATHESGRLVKMKAGNKFPESYKLVNLTTIDSYCTQNNIKIVDILKIDAEGGDVDVIKGADETLLTRNVKILTFECFNCLKQSKLDMIHVLDEKYGFDCYLAGLNNLFIRITNCVNLNFIPKEKICTKKTNSSCPDIYSYRHPMQWDGNVFCAFRRSIVSRVFDKMSLHKFAGDRRGNIFRDAMLGNNWAEIINQEVHVTDPAKFQRKYGRDAKTFEMIWNK